MYFYVLAHASNLCFILKFFLLWTRDQNGLEITDLEAGRKEKRWRKRWVNEDPTEYSVSGDRGENVLKKCEVVNSYVQPKAQEPRGLNKGRAL